MSKQEKLLIKLRSRPKDFTWDELCSVMRSLGYKLKNSDGSRRKFFHEQTKAVVSLHEPHPRKYLLEYQVNLVLDHLHAKGII